MLCHCAMSQCNQMPFKQRLMMKAEENLNIYSIICQSSKMYYNWYTGHMQPKYTNPDPVPKEICFPL